MAARKTKKGAKGTGRSAAKKGAPNTARRAMKKRAQTAVAKAKAPTKTGAKRKAGKKGAERGVTLDFNHAMLYSQDVGRAAQFYCQRLGFQMVDDFRHEGRLLYARLRAPSGSGTIAVHQIAPGQMIAPNEGVRLYFEVRGLDEFCRKLEAGGRVLDSLPKSMPWGWRHAYLHDPDGHEISLYWAGENRFRQTMMR